MNNLFSSSGCSVHLETLWHGCWPVRPARLRHSRTGSISRRTTPSRWEHANHHHCRCLRRVHAVHCAAQKKKERLDLQRGRQRRQEDLQLHHSCSAKIENLEATVQKQREVKLLAVASASVSARVKVSCVRLCPFLISQIIKKMEGALERRKGKKINCMWCVWKKLQAGTATVVVVKVGGDRRSLQVFNTEARSQRKGLRIMSRPITAVPGETDWRVVTPQNSQRCRVIGGFLRHKGNTDAHFIFLSL